MDYFLDSNISLENLKDKILYYPFSGLDYEVPVRIFADFISEFWFVDTNYFSGSASINSQPSFKGTLEGFTFIKETFVGSKIAQIIFPDRMAGKNFKQLATGYLEQLFLYKEKIIKILFRRGFDYTSLFGPSELETAEKRLGIFFFRGTSTEGGSDHPWISNREVRMLYGEKKVRLLSKVLDALPDGGLIVTDGSLGYGHNQAMPKTNEYYPLHEFSTQRSNTSNDAYQLAHGFKDSKGNFFTCVGHAGMKNGPTLVWQVRKSGKMTNSFN